MILEQPQSLRLNGFIDQTQERGKKRGQGLERTFESSEVRGGQDYQEWGQDFWPPIFMSLIIPFNLVYIASCILGVKGHGKEAYTDINIVG